MTDSSIIQQARDVLAKWRVYSTEGPWELENQGESEVAPDTDLVWGARPAWGHEPVAAIGRADGPLAVGTAGNPDLLDAIDGLLAGVQHWASFASVPARVEEWADSIAAAIVAADERMSA